MQSKQERVLEEFMQRSFGSQYIYRPEKHRMGNAHREPADLAWYSNGLVVLFYMTSSNRTHQEQAKHNQRQAGGYHRLWSSGKQQYALRGRNAFGDTCYVPYASIEQYITILIVSGQCGIEILEPITKKIANATILIPEVLLHWLTEFGGTVVDLLAIVRVWLKCASSKMTSDEESSLILRAFVMDYIQSAIQSTNSIRRHTSITLPNDYAFISNHLNGLKNLAKSTKNPIDYKFRESIAKVFCDLTFAEYATLAVASEEAIHASEPPLFKKWIVLKFNIYYSFVIATVRLGSTDMAELNKAIQDASKDELGEDNSVLIIYANVLDSNDHRKPLLIAIPKKCPPNHAAVLAKAIIENRQ